jgi:hypothetical protein
VATIVWLWTLVKAFGLHEYARVQYSKLEANRPLWDATLTPEENWIKVRERMACARPARQESSPPSAWIREGRSKASLY